ncbi:MAG TPA: GNAT family N-acetyltransferase [Burkholderiaceae bacterium]|nr:GNAT family N-acetyltransferase [Burkholderiaceae bacterium]
MAGIVIGTPTVEEVRSGELGRRLRQFNHGVVGEYPETQPVWLNARDADGALMGGLRGFVFLGWLTVELLFVEEAARGAGLGSRLLAQAEAQARERGATRARLDTFEWQARGFYLRHGYEEFARIDDYVGGHWLASMRKVL